jgi:hypothetical protein
LAVVRIFNTFIFTKQKKKKKKKKKNPRIKNLIPLSSFPPFLISISILMLIVVDESRKETTTLLPSERRPTRTRHSPSQSSTSTSVMSSL